MHRSGYRKKTTNDKGDAPLTHLEKGEDIITTRNRNNHLGHLDENAYDRTAKEAAHNSRR